jgi:predicted MFS family arabinose efflux permease
MTKMLGLLTGMAALGGAIGPVFGGLITETMGWPWIFFLNIPVAILAFLAVKWGADESYDTEYQGRIDYIGIFLLLGFISSLALFIAKVTVWGALSPLSIGLAGISLLFFFLFKTWENKITNPLVDLKLFQNRTFAGFIFSGALSKMYLTIIIFTTMILLEKVLSYDPLKSGLFFLAISGTISISSLFLSTVTKAIGDKSTLLLSLMLQIMGAFILLNHSEPIWILVGLAVAGPGCSWGYSTAMVGSILTLPRNLVGLASSASLTIIVMSAGIGVTVAGAVINSFSKNSTLVVGVDTSIAAGILACVFAFIIAITVIPKRN